MPRASLAGLFPIALLVVLPVAAAQEAGEADEATILGLIEDLGAESWTARLEATEALVDVGETAIPYLEAAADDPDPEVRRRVEEILRILTEEPKSHLQKILAARLSEDLKRKVVEQPIAINVSSLTIPAFGSLLQAIGQVRIESSDAVRRLGATITMNGESRPLGEALEQSLATHGIVYTERSGVLYLATADEVLSDQATVGILVETLESPDASLRRRAYSLLRILTSCRIEFRPTAEPEERATGLEAWRGWYSDHASNLRWNPEEGRFDVVD